MVWRVYETIGAAGNARNASKSSEGWIFPEIEIEQWGVSWILPECSNSSDSLPKMV